MMRRSALTLGGCLLLVSAAPLSLAACGGGETEMEETMDDMGDRAGEAAEEMRDEADDAADEVSDEIDDAT